jgi:hypothetical protein
MSEAIEPIAVVTDYRGLVMPLRQRIVDLGTHMEAVDEAAGLPARYTSKLLSENNRTSLGRISLGPLLGTLGLKLAVVPDADALARIRHRLPVRGACGPQLQAGSAVARSKGADTAGQAACGRADEAPEGAALRRTSWNRAPA